MIREATPAGILAAIEELTNWDWLTGYSFAHIVTGDINLGDGSILYCLRPDWIAQCVKQDIRDSFGREVDFDKLEPWERDIYSLPIRRMTKTLSLLDWLLDIDEEIREKAEELYHNGEFEEL